MRDITLMPNDYIVTHIKTDTICEHFNNDDVVYVVEERIVPLVRCEECKRWSYSSLADNHNRCERTLKLTKADDFCSYGDREGEEIQGLEYAENILDSSLREQLEYAENILDSILKEQEGSEE